MKKFQLIFVFVLLAFQFSCATHQDVKIPQMNFQPEKPEVVVEEVLLGNATVVKKEKEREYLYKSSHYGILPGPDDAQGAAEAQATLWQGWANAKVLLAMAKNLENADTSHGIRANFLIAIINNDPKKSAYYYHPEFPKWKIEIGPRGGHFIAPFETIPVEIVLYNSSNDRMGPTLHPLNDYNSYNRRHQQAYKKKVGGVDVDYKFTINKIP